MPCDDPYLATDIPTQEIVQSQDIKSQQPATKKTFDSERASQQAYRYLCHIQEAKQWIESVLGTSLDCSVGDFEARLQNGVILAKLAQHFCPKVVKRIHDPDSLRPLEFRHSDNTNFFFKALRELDFPTYFNFELVDLYDRKNMPRVIYCLHVLIRFLNRARLAPAIQPALTAEFDEEDVLRAQSTLDPLLSMPAFDSIEDALNAVSERQVVEVCELDSVDNDTASQDNEYQSVESIEMSVEEACNAVVIDSFKDNKEQQNVTMTQNDQQSATVLSACKLQDQVKTWLAGRVFTNRVKLIGLLQRLVRVNQAKQVAKQWRSHTASTHALALDLALIPKELDKKLVLLDQGALTIFEYAACGAERCRMAVLDDYLLVTVLPTQSRPTINDLCRVLVKQPSKIDFLPGFFNYGRGEESQAAWTETIIALMPVSKEQAREALNSLLKHNMMYVALTQTLLTPTLSVRDGIDAFMNLLCASGAMMRVISHHPPDAPYYLVPTISEAPEIHASILRSIFHFHDNTSPATSRADDEAELVRIWRTKLDEMIAKHTNIPKQIKSWPVCYVHSSLATAMEIYCPPTQVLAFVEERKMDTSVPTRESVIVILKQYGVLMAKTVTKHPKRNFWHKLVDSIGLQPTFVKEWISQVGSIPKNGVYARTIGHLLKKNVILASTFGNDTAVIFWSTIPGEYFVEVEGEKCCVRLDQLLYNQTATVAMFSNQATFEFTKLIRLLSTKLVLLG